MSTPTTAIPQPVSSKDGALVAAAEEERFLRIKHWAGFPTEAVRWCLREARVGLADVEQVAINQDSRAGGGVILRSNATKDLTVPQFDRIRFFGLRPQNDTQLFEPSGVILSE